MKAVITVRDGVGGDVGGCVARLRWGVLLTPPGMASGKLQGVM